MHKLKKLSSLLLACLVLFSLVLAPGVKVSAEKRPMKKRS